MEALEAEEDSEYKAEAQEPEYATDRRNYSVQ